MHINNLSKHTVIHTEVRFRIYVETRCRHSCAHSHSLSTFFPSRLLPLSIRRSVHSTNLPAKAHRGIFVFVALQSTAENLLGDSRFNLTFVLEVTALFQANYFLLTIILIDQPLCTLLCGFSMGLFYFTEADSCKTIRQTSIKKTTWLQACLSF